MIYLEADFSEVCIPRQLWKSHQIWNPIRYPSSHIFYLLGLETQGVMFRISLSSRCFVWYIFFNFLSNKSASSKSRVCPHKYVQLIQDSFI